MIKIVYPRTKSYYAMSWGETELVPEPQQTTLRYITLMTLNSYQMGAVIREMQADLGEMKERSNRFMSTLERLAQPSPAEKT